MTRDQLNAAWQRYMHRTDLTADLDLTYTLAAERVTERLLFDDVDLALILEQQPRMLLHAGLNQLAELAQDDVQAQREQGLFETAVQDYSINYSFVNTVPAMSRPYYPGDEDYAS